jgi:hypothetical protein
MARVHCGQVMDWPSREPHTRSLPAVLRRQPARHRAGRVGAARWRRGLHGCRPIAASADAGGAARGRRSGVGATAGATRARAPTLASTDAAVPITSVAPSTTATALTSISTGLTPGEHGIVGYRMEMSGEVAQHAALVRRPRRLASPGGSPPQTQPFQPFIGERIAVVSKAELEHSAFTEAHLRGSEPAGWRAASSMAVIIRSTCSPGGRSLSCTPTTTTSTRSPTSVGSVTSTTQSCASVDSTRRRAGARRPAPGGGAAGHRRPRSGTDGRGGSHRPPHAGTCCACVGSRVARGASVGYMLAPVRSPNSWLLAREQHGHHAWVHSQGRAHRCWVVRARRQPAGGCALRRCRAGAVRADQFSRPCRLGSVPAGVSTRVTDRCRDAGSPCWRQRRQPTN